MKFAPGTRVLINVACPNTAPIWVDGVIAGMSRDGTRYNVVPDSKVCIMAGCHPDSIREKHTDHIHVGG